MKIFHILQFTRFYFSRWIPNSSKKYDKSSSHNVWLVQGTNSHRPENISYFSCHRTTINDEWRTHKDQISIKSITCELSRAKRRVDDEAWNPFFVYVALKSIIRQTLTTTPTSRTSNNYKNLKSKHTRNLCSISFPFKFKATLFSCLVAVW